MRNNLGTLMMFTAALALVALGCGSDDSTGSGTGAQTGGSSETGGAAVTGGSAATGGSSSDTGGSDTATMCDPNGPTTMTCGDVECPMPSDILLAGCVFPCCTTDGLCGTQGRTVGADPTACQAKPLPPMEDPSCPHYQGDYMGMAIDLAGCCNDQNVCGVISTLTNSCITQSSVLTDLAPGGPCGDEDAGM